jgi:uncharacterized protein
MKGTLRDIVTDGLILVIVSSVVAIAANLAVTALKKEGAKDDPIVTAIQQNNLELITKLAQAGADETNLVDDFGRTALMRAAYTNLSSRETHESTDRKRAAIAKLLLDQGARIDAVDKDGWTALMWAAWSGTTEVTKVLIARGASVGNQDRQGNTALTIAAQRGNAAIVEALVGYGADLSAKTKHGQTALDLVKSGTTDNPGRKDAYKETLRHLGGY